MLVFAAIFLQNVLDSRGYVPGPLRGARSAPRSQKVARSQNCSGARHLHQHCHWVIGGKNRKMLKTPDIDEHGHHRQRTGTEGAGDRYTNT